MAYIDSFSKLLKESYMAIIGDFENKGCLDSTSHYFYHLSNSVMDLEGSYFSFAYRIIQDTNLDKDNAKGKMDEINIIKIR